MYLLYTAIKKCLSGSDHVHTAHRYQVFPLNFANPILCKFLPPPPPPTMWADWPLAEDDPASGWDLSLSVSFLAKRGIRSHLLLCTGSGRRRRRNAVEQLGEVFPSGWLLYWIKHVALVAASTGWLVPFYYGRILQYNN